MIHRESKWILMNPSRQGYGCTSRYYRPGCSFGKQSGAGISQICGQKRGTPFIIEYAGPRPGKPPVISMCRLVERAGASAGARVPQQHKGCLTATASSVGRDHLRLIDEKLKSYSGSEAAPQSDTLFSVPISPVNQTARPTWRFLTTSNN